MSKDTAEETKKFAHLFVKTEGFEKSIAFEMSLANLLWETMSKKKNFRMVLEYDAEELNVNIDFEENIKSQLHKGGTGQ